MNQQIALLIGMIAGILSLGVSQPAAPHGQFSLEAHGSHGYYPYKPYRRHRHPYYRYDYFRPYPPFYYFSTIEGPFMVIARFNRAYGISNHPLA